MGEILADAVADTVRAEMARRRKTQQDVASVLGVSRQALSRRLLGEIPFDVAELALIAEYLGVPVAHFIPTDVAA